MGLSQRVDCFVVAADQDREDGREFLPLKVLVEMAEGFVFFGAVHVVEVLLVPQGLEIAADEKQVKLEVKFVLQGGQLMVDFLELAVETALDGHLYKRLLTFMSINCYFHEY